MSYGESPCAVRRRFPGGRHGGEAGRMHTQDCSVRRKGESSCTASGSAEAVRKLLPHASSAALQPLMGLRIAEGSWGTWQKAADGLEADNFIFVKLPAPQANGGDRAEACSVLCPCQGRTAPSPAPACSHGRAPGGTPGHTALQRLVTTMEHVERSPSPVWQRSKKLHF